MDIWIAHTPQNAERVVTTLQAFGFDLPELSVDLFLEEGRIIRLGVPPIRIELVTGVSGVHFDECYRTRVADVLDGVPVNLIDLAHLKTNKQAAGRHKDLDDLETLP